MASKESRYMRAKSLAPPNGLAESESTPDTRKLHMDVPVGRRTSMASLCSLMIERPDSEFTLGPLEKGRNCWSEPPATSFPVRGKKYMTDKKKYNSAESMFILVDVDIFRSTTPGRFTEFASSGVSYIDYATAHGETRFMVCMHFQSNTYNMVCTWVVDPARLEKMAPESIALWEKFLNGDDSYRNSRFKVIPRVIEGNWLVMKACGTSKPVLYATKLTHYYRKTDRFFEISCDTTSSKIASSLADLCVGKASTLTFDMAIMIEGRDESELPEQILGVFRMTKPDLKHCRKVLLPSKEDIAHSKPSLGDLMTSMSLKKRTSVK